MAAPRRGGAKDGEDDRLEGQHIAARGAAHGARVRHEVAGQHLRDQKNLMGHRDWYGLQNSIMSLL